MNEFTAKKLGEVMAFANIFEDTFQRGKEAMLSVLGEEVFADHLKKNEAHHQSIEKLTDEEMKAVVLAKAERTGAKLKAMRDMYIGDEWDNATELMEWSGFFEGAAIVHWSLVNGAAESLEHTRLAELANEALEFHRSIFETFNRTIKDVARTKAQQ